MLKMIFKNAFKKRVKKPYSGEMPKEEDFNFDLIEHYFKYKNHSSVFQIVDTQLINDVDLYELFIFIDRTHSKIGQQYLYNLIHSINKTLYFEEQEALINYFTKHEDERIKIQSLFSKLNKRESYYISHLFLDGFVPKPKWFWVVRIFSIAGIVALLLTFLFNNFFILLIVTYIINILFYLWNKNNIMVYSDSIPQLLPLCKIAKELIRMNIIPKSEQNILPAVHSINELKNKIKFFRNKTGLISELEALVLFLWEAVNILFVIEPQIVFNVLGKLDKKGKISKSCLNMSEKLTVRFQLLPCERVCRITVSQHCWILLK